MNKHSQRLAVYLIPCLIATVAAVAIRTVALFTDLDTVYGYFKTGITATVSNSIATVFCVFALSYLLFGAKGALRASFDSPATYLPSGVCATCLVLLSVSLFSYSAGYAPAVESGTNNLHLYLAVACGICALPAAAHFFMNAYQTDSKDKIRALLSIFTLVFLCLYALMVYFDSSLPLNSPAKVIDQLSLLFAALFFVYESRISLGRELWRGYIAFGLAASLMCAYSSIPSLILYFVKGYSVSMLPEENLFVFALFVFITARLLLIFRLCNTNDEGGIEVLRSYALERKAAVDEEEKMYQSAFAVQLTIDDIGEEGTAPETTEIEESDSDDANTASESENNDQFSINADLFDTYGGENV